MPVCFHAHKRRLQRPGAHWAVSSAGRALPSQGRGREFESPTVHRLLQPSRGRLAQLEERCLHTAEVTGSSPVSPIRQVKGEKHCSLYKGETNFSVMSQYCNGALGRRCLESFSSGVFCLGPRPAQSDPHCTTHARRAS